MTVENTNKEESYTGNGSVTVFAYDFLIYSAEHMFVYFDDVVQTMGFTIDGIGADDGGNVTFTIAPDSGVIVKLERIVPFTQLIEYQQYGPFDAEANERGLDLAAMRDIQTESLIAAKMDKQPDSAEDNVIIFDSTGNSKDSNINIGDLVPTDISGKMDKTPTATEDNLVSFDSAGNSKDSGISSVTAGRPAFVTIAEIAGGVIPIGDTAHVSDRGDGLVTVTSGGVADGIGILNAGGGNTAPIDKSTGEVEATWYGADNTNIGSITNYIIDDLNQAVLLSTGGIINLPFAQLALDETIIIHNPTHNFNIDSIELKGAGRHATIIDASAVAGNALEMRLGIYNTLADFTVFNSQANGIFIDDGPLNDEPAFNNTFKNIVLSGSAENGMYVGRSFVMSYYDNEYVSATEAGCYSDFRIHTSQNRIGEYYRNNTGAGLKAEYLIYSSFLTCASDENLYGFELYGCRGVGTYASGAESNKRAGWYYRSNNVHEINWASGTSCVAVNNNLDDLSFANHTEMLAENDITNFLALRQPVSLKAAGQPTSYDFKAQGKGSVLSIEDPYMENEGPRATASGFIQINYTAPKLIHQMAFSGPQDNRTLLLLKNQNGLTDDWSGELLITVSNAYFGSPALIGTATYKLLVSQSLQGSEQAVISQLGLVNGTNVTHPSFTFEVFAGGLFATAVSQTEGDFWFAIEKVSGNLMWND